MKGSKTEARLKLYEFLKTAEPEFNRLKQLILELEEINKSLFN
jgi:hypothetical protein